MDGDELIPQRRRHCRQLPDKIIRRVAAAAQFTAQQPSLGLGTDHALATVCTTRTTNSVFVVNATAFEAAKRQMVPWLIQELQDFDSDMPPRMTVIDQRHQTKPSCLVFKSRQPHAVGSFAFCDFIQGIVVATVGRGAFGHVVLAKETSTTVQHHYQPNRALKVDLNHFSVMWEAYVHRTVSTPRIDRAAFTWRLCRLSREHKSCSAERISTQDRCSPHMTAAFWHRSR